MMFRSDSIANVLISPLSSSLCTCSDRWWPVLLDASSVQSSAGKEGVHLNEQSPSFDVRGQDEWLTCPLISVVLSSVFLTLFLLLSTSFRYEVLSPTIQSPFRYRVSQS